ncbi:unnamed protein product [Rotaria socialis]|uniref:Uncharacterized protein n=1 Tax=Rotaria socialis TaxID=392032 RepID=A0A817WA22_9BILA|nr:unnamed protein product [Rotaria socialis]CAF3353278.1 unnamed protein product [Rotaria socialis]CAF3389019.1 unnamed protein product [Rotaria socialis]CAF3745468.1 unnamed protein product [Rotaria socialis]CAF4392788.1 unnamed protein product [Rotaria socialis]
MTHLSSPHTEERENEYTNALQNANNHFKQENYSNKIDTIHFNTSLKETTKEFNQYQTMFYADQKLLINRSLDNFTRKSINPYFNASLSSQFLHQTSFKRIARRLYYSDISLSMISKYQTKQNMNSSIKLLLRSMDNKNNSSSKLVIEYESILNKQNSLSSLKSDSKDKEESAIIEIEHQSYNSIISSIDLSKPLEKSYSSPLPINAKHFYNNNNLQSAHFIDQYSEDRSELSLDSSMNEIENNQSIKNIYSYDNNIENNIRKKTVQRRWSLLDIWKTTINKLPPIVNCIWRQQLRRTGSREFLLEYDQASPMNNNQTSRVQEQRYVEQERSINTHFGLALLALLIFPPIGIVSIILSIWSLCGQQDRHLSRKLGNAAYWISLLAICFSFFLLVTLFTYFTYQYLINRPIRTK